MRASKRLGTGERASKRAPRGDARTVGMRSVPELIKIGASRRGLPLEHLGLLLLEDHENVDPRRHHIVHVPERAARGVPTPICVNPHQ